MRHRRNLVNVLEIQWCRGSMVYKFMWEKVKDWRRGRNVNMSVNFKSNEEFSQEKPQDVWGRAKTEEEVKPS